MGASLHKYATDNSEMFQMFHMTNKQALLVEV